MWPEIKSIEGMTLGQGFSDPLRQLAFANVFCVYSRKRFFRTLNPVRGLAFQASAYAGVYVLSGLGACRSAIPALSDIIFR